MSRGSSPSSSLPPTLAERIRHLREKRYMTPELLAIKAQVSVQMVEDLEAGIEMFLAPAVRQRIARALHVRPSQLQEVEKPLEMTSPDTPQLQKKGLNLREAILREPDAPHLCPSCGAPLAVRLFERRDLQDNLLVVIKANCTRCLFRLTDD
jgi:transcriptional regulator with XRE-family HTH domain